MAAAKEQSADAVVGVSAPAAAAAAAAATIVKEPPPNHKWLLTWRVYSSSDEYSKRLPLPIELPTVGNTAKRYLQRVDYQLRTIDVARKRDDPATVYEKQTIGVWFQLTKSDAAEWRLDK